MTSFLAWYHQNQAFFWTVFVGVLANLANALSKMPVDTSSKWSIAFHYFLDRVLPTILTKSDAAGTLKFPWIQGSKSLSASAARLPLPPTAPGPRAAALLPWIAFAAFGMPSVSCVHGQSASPTQQQFTSAFTTCCKDAGIQDATNIGLQAFGILNNASGKNTQQILQQIENLGIQDGGIVITQVVNCAVQAWLTANPVGTNKQATPGQGAARLYLFKHGQKPSTSAPPASAPPAVK